MDSPRPVSCLRTSAGTGESAPAESSEEILKDILAELAYTRWLQKGRPEGTALEDWLQAEADLQRLGNLTQELAQTRRLLQETLADSRRREEALRQAEERYHSIFDNALEGIFQSTADGRFLTVNPALAAMLGFASPTELLTSVSNIGQQIHVTPERRAEFQRLLLEQGSIREFECQVRRKEGDVIWLSLTARAVRDSGGNLLYFEGTVQDITQRIRAGQALQDAEALYHSLVETLPVCIFRKDLRGRFTFGNQGFCASLNRPLEEIVGKTDRDFYPGELAAKYLSDDRRVLERGEFLEAIEEHQKPDGQRSYVQVLKAPLYDGRGEAIGMQGIFWDITARMRAEGELARTEAEFRVARTIQQKLFPTTLPKLAGLEIAGGTFGFDIGGASFPAEAIGGDYYDFLSLPDGSLGIAIGDVSGHGVGPALLMAEARALLRAFAQTQADVSTILALVNRVLVPDIEGDRFITLLLAKLDPASRSLVYASAGQQTGYLLDAAGALKRPLPSTGIPLGIDGSATFPSSEAITLHPGDIVLLMTDGVVETRCPEGIAFGAQRPLDVVRVYRQSTAQQIVENLYQAVRAYAQDLPQFDDITAAVIKVNREVSGRKAAAGATLAL